MCLIYRGFLCTRRKPVVTVRPDTFTTNRRAKTRKRPINQWFDPVAQGIEQQPSKLKVAGSNPAGVANFSRKPSRAWRRSQSPAAAKRDATPCSQAFNQLPLTAAVGRRVSAADLCCGAHRTPCYQSRIGKTSRKRSDIGKKTGPIGHRGD